MTAKDIQREIIIAHHKKDICLPNFFYHFWECDVFRLQSNGFIIEYEIKMSVSDFKADFSKKKGDINKHEHIREGKRCNRFFFVTPKGLIDPKEIPDYCGLMEFDGRYFTVPKPAKLIHRNKVGEKYYKELSIKLFFRIKEAKLNLPK